MGAVAFTDNCWRDGVSEFKGKVDKADSNKHLVLYDLKHDPGETTDVAAEHAEIVARLKPQVVPLPHVPENN